MLKRALLFGLLLLPFFGCGGDKQKQPATTDQWNEARSRATALSNSSLPARVLQPVDGNRFRVIAFNTGGVNLGQCAELDLNPPADGGVSLDRLGALLPGQCSSAAQYWAWDKSGGHVAPTLPPPDKPDPSKPRSDNWLGEHLNLGAFYQESHALDVNSQTEVAIGPIDGKGEVTFSRRLLVMEWRRYVLRALCESKDDMVVECSKSTDKPGTAPSNASKGYVSGVEWGIALRVFFDVKLVQTSVSVGAKFGFASLAEALTTGNASVEVSYDIIGTTRDLLPQEPTVITGVGEYIGAMQRFYRAVWETSQGLDDAQKAIYARRAACAAHDALASKKLEDKASEVAKAKREDALEVAAKARSESIAAEERLVGRYPLGIVSYYVSGKDASKETTPDSRFKAQQGNKSQR